MKKDKSELYGWIFTFNPHTGNYRCCKREDYLRFFNEPEENFLRSKSIDTLEELILKSGGKKEIIDSLSELYDMHENGEISIKEMNTILHEDSYKSYYKKDVEHIKD